MFSVLWVLDPSSENYCLYLYLSYYNYNIYIFSFILFFIYIIFLPFSTFFTRIKHHVTQNIDTSVNKIMKNNANIYNQYNNLSEKLNCNIEFLFIMM